MKNFKEIQKFNQWWIWIIAIVIGIVNTIFFYKNGFDFDLSSLAQIFVIASSFVFIFIFKLKTEISKEGIKMNFFPFVKKNVNWQDVENVEVLNYGFVGGWGIRFWTKYGTVYNIRGNVGIAVNLKNGKKFLIGTQKEQELIDCIKSHKKVNGIFE